MLLHTSYLDLKTREIDLKIWLIYSPLVILFIFEYKHLSLFLYLYSVITTNMLILVFYWLSLMGGADLFLSLILSFSNASVKPFLFPALSMLGLEPLTILLYSSAMIFFAGVLNLLKNYKYTSGYPFTTRLTLSLSGKRITVREFLNSKFLFPLTQIDEQSGTITLRTTFSVEEDDAEWRKKFKEYVEKGLIKEDDYIWVMWGVPVIPFIAIGYFLSLIVGLPI
ncbi:A24 family peptidase C-terminal domain-containing protein [Sulfurisphaera javensis]|uniref:A24 family peptidase C-terminal domain-containing protein n=1 Tax=Sulfurisphaera javensis TaxID=2049879 RepID=A0AAT9GP91_9CREN